MSDDIPKDVNPKIAKLVAAIGQKRRELGFLEWGQLPIEDVVERLTEKPKQERKKRQDPEKPGGKNSE